MSAAYDTSVMNEANNQPPPLVDYNLWQHDPALRAAVEREGGGWIEARAAALGALLGTERLQWLAAQANRHTPELKTHDRYGNRIDAVEYHPAYHELMAVAFGNGLHSIAWKPNPGGARAEGGQLAEGGRHVARGALLYLWNQLENGVACPVTMSFAAVHMLRHDAALAAVWEPKLLADDYDPRPLPVAEKRAVTIGMAMTERQGGSDLRANQTAAVAANTHGAGWFALTGHKWFCSAPMSDGFFTLARTAPGLSCYFVPRSLADGSRNRFHLQRLKDKCGNRSNASGEVEYDRTLARRVGEEGRGIATLIEMAHLTRFDIVLASAGMMRAALAQALHHANFRSAFGRLLAEQPLMQNVLADLALESEAATLFAFRLARAFDAGLSDSATDTRERLLMRLMTPIAKYWLCKRMPAVVVEAMECLGGNGYVEEAPLSRLYREAPLNGIWEGSGNVICLDVLRSFARAPEAKEALLAEIRLGGTVIEPFAAAVETALADAATLEVRARRVVELMALALQASLMQRHASPEAAGAFVASRSGDWGRAFGTLPASAPLARILAQAAA